MSMRGTYSRWRRSTVERCEISFSVIRQFHEQEKLVAAICAAPYALAKAGLFKGISYTATIDYQNSIVFQ